MMKQFIKKNILKFERYFRRKELNLSVEQLKKLRILQLKSTNINNITNNNENNDIKITDIPHYKLAKGIVDSDDGNLHEELVDNYRKNLDKEPEEAQKKVQNFFAYFELFKTGKIKSKPVVLTKLKVDGPLYIADGDHRCAFSLALNRPLKASILPFDLLFRLHWNKEQRNQILDKFNYSIRLNDHLLMPGYRDDMDQKMSMIPDGAIKDKNVIDITASFGMSAIAAMNAGANSVTCIAESEDIANWSNRFTYLSGYHADIHIKNMDRKLSNEQERREFDTLILNLEAIQIENYASFIKFLNYKYLIVELEPNKNIETYECVLKNLKLKKQEMIGKLCRSRKDPALVREVWIAERIS